MARTWCKDRNPQVENRPACGRLRGSPPPRRARLGSFVAVTRLTPSATTWPSFTITAAKGPPAPVRTFSIPKAIARRMNSFIIRDSSRFRVPLPPANINVNIDVPFPPHSQNGANLRWRVRYNHSKSMSCAPHLSEIDRCCARSAHG